MGLRCVKYAVLARRADHSLEMMGWIRQQAETPVLIQPFCCFRGKTIRWAAAAVKPGAVPGASVYESGPPGIFTERRKQKWIC